MAHARTLAVSLLLLISVPMDAAEPDFSEVVAWIEGEIERHRLPGAALLVGTQDGVAYERYFGSWGPETRVAIASASKWPSAAAVMTLVDSGELALDTPLAKQLPELDGAKAEITLRHALSLTAGLKRNRFPSGTPTSLEAFTQRFARSGQLIGTPGDDFRYSGSSFQLAGRAAEVAAGSDFRTLFARRLAEPCGFAGMRYDAAGQDRMPLLYGGLTTTLRDYAAFLQMLMRGGTCGETRVLSQRSLAEMHRNQVGTLRLQYAGEDRLERQSRYGLGNWLDVVDADQRAIQSSSPGSFGTIPWIDWRERRYGIFLQTFAEADPTGFIDPFEVVERVHAALDAAGR